MSTVTNLMSQDTELTFHIRGARVCRKAVKRILKISEDRMKRVETLYRKGIKKITSTMPHSRTVSHKRTLAYGWFKRFMDSFGDYMPHSSSIHLPHTLTKLMVYHQMKTQLIDQGLPTSDILKQSAFYNMWDQEFPNCVIPKVDQQYILLYDWSQNQRKKCAFAAYIAHFFNQHQEK